MYHGLKRLMYLLCLTAWFNSIVLSRPLNAAPDGVIYITAGTPAPANGFWMSVSYGQDVASGWMQAKRDKDIWQTAYGELRQEILTSAETTRQNLKTLELAITNIGRQQRVVGRNQTLLWTLILTGIVVTIHH